MQKKTRLWLLRVFNNLMPVASIKAPIEFRPPLKMHFFRDCRVSSVLESSCMSYTLRFSARCFLALTKKVHF